MAFQILKSADVPRPTRKKRRVLESSNEWMMLRAKLSEGLKPHEEIVVSFNARDREQYKIKTLKRVFRDMTKKFVRDAKLPYAVDAYSSEGNEIIVVRNEIVFSKSKGSQKAG